MGMGMGMGAGAPHLASEMWVNKGPALGPGMTTDHTDANTHVSKSRRGAPSFTIAENDRE